MTIMHENLPRHPFILCCHGVYYQGKMHSEFPEDRPVYEKQLRESIRIVQGKSYDLLIISGGYTKKAIEKSEAQGMVDWALDLRLDIEEIPFILEEYSRDSFENVLFSMCRYYKEYEQFPNRIGICSWKSKKRRFEIIAEALKLPYHFLGIGEKEALARAEAQQVERIRTDPFHRSPYLASKRQRRDPWRKGNPYTRIQVFEDMFRTLNSMEEKELTDPSLVKIPWNLF